MGAPTSGWGTVAKIAGAGVSGAMKGQEKRKEGTKSNLEKLRDVADKLRGRAAEDVADLSSRDVDPRTGSITSFKRGGKVKRTGIYRLHKGERVVRARSHGGRR